MEDDFEFPSTGNVEEEMMDDIPKGVDDPISPIIKVNGLKKKILKEGEGWEAPGSSDEVEVHYTGTLLDGTKFDSSCDRGTPFKFKLGQESITYWTVIYWGRSGGSSPTGYAG